MAVFQQHQQRVGRSRQAQSGQSWNRCIVYLVSDNILYSSFTWTSMHLGNRKWMLLYHNALQTFTTMYLTFRHLPPCTLPSDIYHHVPYLQTFTTMYLTFRHLPPCTLPSDIYHHVPYLQTFTTMYLTFRHLPPCTLPSDIYHHILWDNVQNINSTILINF